MFDLKIGNSYFVAATNAAITKFLIFWVSFQFNHLKKLSLIIFIIFLITDKII